MVAKRVWAVGVWSLLAAACGKDARLAPLLPPCTASGDSIVLGAVAADTALDPGSDSGCAVFPANLSGSQLEYLVVAQSASARDNDSSTYWLRGATLGAAAAPPARALAAVAPGAQEQFDLTLRQAERELALSLGPQPRLQAPAPAGPASLAASRPFKVCGNTDCTTHPSVNATLKTTGTHVAIYVDNAAIAAGDTLGPADVDALVATFDTLLYPADVAAFGSESDIDVNGRVLVLMTGKVNSLIPKPCADGFIAGYFYGGDLIQGFSGGNNAEIFYSMVPDPLGTLSCIHSVTDVKNIVPGTFIHEFQHMISFNQHVLLHCTSIGCPPPEDLWLNEGMSHYAEELGGRLYAPGDSAAFCRFLVGDLYNAGQYLASPGDYFLVDGSGVGGLPNRGAYWLFVRFLVDRFATGTDTASANVVTRALDGTSLTGAANVVNVTGTPFATLIERWGLANYVSDLATDLPGFSTPPELQYVTWHFRTDFPRLRAKCGTAKIPLTFPLVPAAGAGNVINLSGYLRAGSGTYYLAQQAASDPGFTLLFSDGSGRALRTSLVPRLTVIRIQ